MLSSGHCIDATLYRDDVALAAACARGDAIAVARFESLYASDVRLVHARSRGAKPPVDELVQVVWTKLFVGPSPRIAEYGGKGTLRNWVRVIATRSLIEMARRQKPEVDLEESGVVPLVAPDDDPEMAYLKRRYAHEIKDAFERAAKALDPEERNVLREHYAGGLGIDQIAAVHGIHRATAARRLSCARESVLAGTRRILAARLGLSRAELESIARMVESRMHLTAERIFA